jgi:hypothetical protein
LIDYGLEKIDEIYMVSHLTIYSEITKLYPNIKYTLFEEGPGTLSYPVYNYSKIKRVIVHNYLEKFEYVVWHKTKIEPAIEFVDEEIFKITLSEVRKKLNILLDFEKNKKYILLCGPDIESKAKMKKETVYNIISRLIDNGYTILFKKHPRDTDPYIFNDSVINIDTSYPIELYDLNIVAVVNFTSSVCITIPYFNNIAVFSDTRHLRHKKVDMPHLSVLTHFILKQYTVPVDILLDFDHGNYSPADLTKKYMEVFKTHIEKIPVVKDNKTIMKFIKKIKYE